jgi:hypothetical protein
MAMSFETNQSGGMKGSALGRIEWQVTCIESIVSDLLADLKIQELSSYQRLSLAVRLLAQHQRALILHLTHNASELDEEERSLADLLRKCMLPQPKAGRNNEDGDSQERAYENNHTRISDGDSR